MAAQPLNLAGIDLNSIVTEVDQAVTVVEDVLQVVQKFDSFLPAGIVTAVTDLSNILTALKSILDKV